MSQTVRCQRHMNDGSMFTGLMKYRNKSFWEGHKTITFDTLTDRHQYEVITVFKTVVYLNNAQTERLQEVLQHTLFDYEVTKTERDKELSEQNLVESFLSAKRIEGCSEKTLKYYNATIQSMLDGIGKGIKYIVTDDIRCYLTEYQAKKKSSKVTIDNIRRILSSFFSWLEDEDYILKSPVRNERSCAYLTMQ